MTMFVRGLGNHLKAYNISIVDEDEKSLAYILDASNSGYVTSYRVSEFLKGFGPLKRAIPYVRGEERTEVMEGAERFASTDETSDGREVVLRIPVWRGG
jgi:hypothetical protein